MGASGPYGAPTGQGGYGPPPGYGQTPPSYGSPYGQPAGPSRPLSGQGAPDPGYGQYGQYGQPGPGGAGGPPLAASPWGSSAVPMTQVRRQQGRFRIIASVVTLVVIAAVVAIGVLTSKSGGIGGSSNVIYSNALTSSSQDWNNDDHCSFASDGYHIKNGFICYAPAGDVGDATVTADVKMLSGSTTESDFGITLRRVSQGNYYQFGIDGNSEWEFDKGAGGKLTSIIEPTSNSAIHGGLNSVNTLQVVAKGSHFDLFINGTKVGQADDTTFTTGKVGLFTSDNAEAVFTNLKVTK